MGDLLSYYGREKRVAAYVKVEKGPGSRDPIVPGKHADWIIYVGTLSPCTLCYLRTWKLS